MLMCPLRGKQPIGHILKTQTKQKKFREKTFSHKFVSQVLPFNFSLFDES